MAVEGEGVGSLGSLVGLLCVGCSPAAPSAWFVCGSLTGLGHIKKKRGPAWLCALSFMNALLFFFFKCTPQVPVSRIPSFRPIQGKCKHHTLLWPVGSIPMVWHQSGSPTYNGEGLRSVGSDWGKNCSCRVVQEARGAAGQVQGPRRKSLALD